jgi:hypothetical protein
MDYAVTQNHSYLDTLWHGLTLWYCIAWLRSAGRLAVAKSMDGKGRERGQLDLAPADTLHAVAADHCPGQSDCRSTAEMSLDLATTS